MCEYNPELCQIITIENYEKRIPIARDNFKKAGKEEQIELLEGDAAEILPTLTEPFDFIFMDAAKGQYLHFLPEVLRLLKSGGLLVSDNILQEGDLIESRFAVERRNRTIYKRMREYLYELKHNDELVTSLLPLGRWGCDQHETIGERIMRIPELLDSASSLEVLAGCGYIWCGCSLYRRRGFRSACKSKELFKRRYVRRGTVCPRTWCKSIRHS